jgi:hypothetical protein
MTERRPDERGLAFANPGEVLVSAPAASLLEALAPSG